jgi:hypothetical protein
MKRRRPGPEPEKSEESAHAVSAAEEAARQAGPRALTDEEKAQLAAEASRSEDA